MADKVNLVFNQSMPIVGLNTKQEVSNITKNDSEASTLKGASQADKDETNLS